MTTTNTTGCGRGREHMSAQGGGRSVPIPSPQEACSADEEDDGGKPLELGEGTPVQGAPPAPTFAKSEHERDARDLAAALRILWRIKEREERTAAV